MNLHAIPHLVISLFGFSLGIFVYLQNKKSLTNISYLFVSISASLWQFADAFVMSAAAEEAISFWIKFVYVGISFIPASMYFFVVSWFNLFEKRKKWVFFNYFMGSLFILLFFLTDKFVIGYQKYFFGNFSRLSKLSFLYLIYFFGASGIFFINLFRGYFGGIKTIKKIHIKLTLISFLIAFIGSTEFLPSYGIGFYPIGCFTIVLFLIIVAYTIIRYKLLDIETVFHKTIAWIITNLALLTPFVLLGYFIKSWYAKLNFLSAVGFLSGISLAFLFFIKLFQPKVDHFFQRRRYNLEEIAIHFTEQLVHLRDLNQLIQSIENTIANTLYTSIDIFIYSDNLKGYKLANTIAASNKLTELQSDQPFLLWLVKNDKIVYREFVDIDPKYTFIRKEADDYFNLSDAIVVMPLVLNERLLGVINLGKKANLRRYSAIDFHFLTALKNQSTIAISNSLLYENIEEQVKQRTRELVEVQKQLIQAEKLATVGTLAGGVAHEINNPLTAILTNVQMLLACDGVDDKLDKESLQLIEEATKRCRAIVKKLMTYAKKPLETTEISEVNLLNVLKNVISFLGYQLEQENIKIIIGGKEKEYLVMGNQNELEQVVTNIILNAKDAIKQVKRAGDIHVSFGTDTEWIEMKIRDEGAGIPREIMPKIFDPFFTTKEVGKGVGLGLSICQSIVEKHNGVIAVESEPQKGSVFTVRLPKITGR